MADKKTPRQKPLPGMQDRKLTKLHNTAMEYAELRDQRMALGAQEVEKKGQLLDLMKAHKKEHYEYGGVVIDIVHESENVKVNVVKQEIETDEVPDQEEESDVQPD